MNGEKEGERSRNRERDRERDREREREREAARSNLRHSDPAKEDYYYLYQGNIASHTSLLHTMLTPSISC